MLNLLNEASGSKFVKKKKNRILSMINQMQFMMQEMKLTVIQKF